MTVRRALSEMLAEVADGMMDGARLEGLVGLRATSMELSLPVDVALEQRNDELTLLAELPRFVIRTSFDRPPSRLTVVLIEEAAP
jgi:hypothetical protein